MRDPEPIPSVAPASGLGKGDVEPSGAWTPEPWYVAFGSSGQHEVRGPGSITVAVVFLTPDGRSAANADLLAAAPTMAAAHAKIAGGDWLGAVRFAEDTDADFLLRVIAKMRAVSRAALAKASGAS